MDTRTNTSYDGWIGNDAYDSAGEKIGEIKDIFYDDVTGRPEWLALKTGMFGGANTFVPIAGSSNFTDHDGNQRLQVPFTKSMVKDAPRIEASEDHLSPMDERALYEYYGFDQQDKAAVNAGYGKDYRTGQRADKDFQYRRWDRNDNTWGQEQTQEEVVAEATTTTQRVEAHPETVRLRKYSHVEMVPVTKEEIRIEKDTAQGAVQGRDTATASTRDSRRNA